MESSNFKTLRQRAPDRRKKALAEGAIPLHVFWGDGGAPATIVFDDGGESIGSCIHCVNPPCMEYRDEDLAGLPLKDFPAHSNREVCPTGAIRWAATADAPRVDPELCISCGLCVSRCPVAAIWLDPAVGAVVQDEETDYFTLADEPVTEAYTEEILDLFADVPNEGVLLAESDDALLHVYERIAAVWPRMNQISPYLLARNLMIGVGIGSAMRRRGDVSVRMDLLLGAPGVEVGTAAVEIGGGEGILDAPRNTLDNIAVLVSRYEIEKERIVPLIVSLQLPNKRTEYWEVIKDIRKVLELQIGSVTVGLLIVMIWARFQLSLTPDNELYTDSDTYSLRAQVEALLGRKLELTQGYPGFIEAPK